MVGLVFTGKATATKDLVMQTRTLSSSGSFVIMSTTGEFADRVGVTGTFTLAIVCHLVLGESFPQVTPVDITFSAIHIVFDQ
jgi:hypothetical protein